MTLDNFILGMIPAVVFGVVAWALWTRMKQYRRAEFIRVYAWPRGLLDKLATQYPEFTRKESALVSQGLRTFFLAYLLSGRKFVAMPSQVADELWHQFILYTRDYQAFCREAFGGFLHHTPAIKLTPGQKRDNEGLRRVWWYACKDDNIDPRHPTRLPLLFALDAKLNIPSGYRYDLDCGVLGHKDAADTQCAGEFSSVSIDGSTAGFGNGDGGGGDGGDGGGGCGGGGD